MTLPVGNDNGTREVFHFAIGSSQEVYVTQVASPLRANVFSRSTVTTASEPGKLDSHLHSPFTQELHGEKQDPQDDEGSRSGHAIR